MSTILDEIEKRRAHRGISEKTISRDIVERIMKAATLAPSCFNNQPWRFLACLSPDSLARMKETLTEGNYWAKKSPFIVAACTKPSLDCRLNEGRDYAFFGLGLAVENLVLQAVREGLIAHPIAGFKPETVKKTFSIPRDFVVVTLIIIGFPGDPAHLNESHKKMEVSLRDRKPLNEVIAYDSWTIVS